MQDDHLLLIACVFHILSYNTCEVYIHSYIDRSSNACIEESPSVNRYVVVVTSLIGVHLMHILYSVAVLTTGLPH